MRYTSISNTKSFHFLTSIVFLFPLSIMGLSSSFPSSRATAFRAVGRTEWKNVLQMSSLSEHSLPRQILSVAPMMAHTNRHFRTFWRLISKRSVLYTEMVVAEQIVNAHSKQYLQPLRKHLGHNSIIENPLILQLGGNNPMMLSKAASIAYSSGFQSINLNCGCPSNTIASENSMGAAMMYEPERTAECCAAIIEASKNYLISNNYRSDNDNNKESDYREGDFKNNDSNDINNNNDNNNIKTPMQDKINSPDHSFSVKCRTGVDDRDSYEDLHNFIHVISSQGGVKRFQIHARKAILGVSTMANRDVPPLQYARVYRLVEDFPHLEFEINGAISSPNEVKQHLAVNGMLKGAMVGRACINHPYMWINTDKTIYNDDNQVMLTRGEIIEKYAQYCEELEDQERTQKLTIETGKTSSKILLAPIFNIFTGEEYCERFRRDLKRMSQHVTTPSLILRSAVKNIPDEILHGRKGEYRENEDIVVYDKGKKSSGPMKIRIS